MMKLQVAIFTMTWVLLSYSPCFSGSKALLIGIDDYRALPASSRQGIADLKGSINDVRAIKSALISYYGFGERDIRVLINDEATRQNIETVVKEWLIKGTNSGDVVLFYFSGHGSTVPDYNGDERDGLDEVLCPCDARPKGGKNIILDDELGLWLSELAGRSVVVIIDSCHSGGAVRSIKGKIVSVLEDTPAWRARFVPVTDYLPPPIATARPRGTDVPEHVVFMAASREHETAFEVRMSDGFYGGFTFGLYEAMTHLRPVNYEELFDHASKVVKDRLLLPQDPLMIAKKEITPRAVFGIGRPTPPPSTIHCPIRPPEIVGTSVLVALEMLNNSSRRDMEKLREQLAQLPMIDLVEKGSFFDRLVRGEKRNGRYHVRLLNRVGDVERVKPATTVKELVGFLSPHFEYAYTVKQLSRINHPNPPFKVRVWVTDHTRRDFRIGEKVVFGIESERDCYVLLLNVDREGNSHIIFPNRYYQDNFIKAHTPVLIPDKKMRAQGFELLFTPPAGEETIKVIATTEPLKLGALGLRGSQETFQTLSHARSVIFSNKVISTLCSSTSDWSENTVVIRTYALAGGCQEAVQLYNHATGTEDITERERLLTTALALNCDNKKIVAKIRNNLADTYEKEGKLEEAIAEYRRASELDPLLLTPHLSLGDIYFKRGEYEYAIEFYETGLQFQKDSLSRANLKRARQKIPFYKSKREIIESLSLSSATRTIRPVPSINLYFGFDQAQVTGQGEKQLKTLLEALSDHELQLYRFRLIGHACDIGPEAYNQRLSEQRAEAVKTWLVTHQHPRDCLETIGYGEKKPLDLRKSEEARKRNRRVEIRTAALSVVQTRSSNPAVAKGLRIFQEGERLLKACRYPEAKLKFEKALEMFRESRYIEGVRSTTANLYLIYLELGEKDKAVTILHEFNENSS